jgi:glycine cleavage system T protein
MPIEYAGVRSEHRAVRAGSGLFDVSHMGQIEVEGPDARAFLARALTTDVLRMGPGEARYALLLTDSGGIVDDLIVYALPDRHLMVVNAANVEACLARLHDLGPGPGARVADRSPHVAMLALQGPGWEEALTPHLATPAPLALEYFHVCEDLVAGVPCLIARTGYTGEPGVELMCPSEGAAALWDALVRGPSAPVPAGLAARDTLRLEMGYPLHGQDISPSRTPVEAGLTWACDLEGLRFPGAEVIARQAAEGTPERLVAVTLTERGIPRPGCAVLDGAGSRVGVLTSGTLSPTLDVGIGLGYVRSDLAPPGTDLVIDVRGRRKGAVTARRPLVPSSPRKVTSGS